MIHAFYAWLITSEALQILQPTVIVIALFGWGVHVERALARFEAVLNSFKCPYVNKKGDS